MMLPVLASEEDSASAFDLGDSAVPELNSVVDLGFELGEEDLGADHVVCGHGVKYPPTKTILLR
jgi:hypothetical protein